MPPELVAWLPVLNLGAMGALFWLVGTGRLVPRATVERDVRAPLQALAEDRRMAYETERARADLLAAQLARFLRLADRAEETRS